MKEEQEDFFLHSCRLPILIQIYLTGLEGDMFRFFAEKNISLTADKHMAVTI